MSSLYTIIAVYSTTIIVKSSSIRDGSRLLLQHACTIDADCNGGHCATPPTQPNFCVCTSGWTGPNCQINIDDCDPNPCLNGGTCRDAVNSFSCTCAPGYTGDRCQTPPDTSAEHKPQTQVTPSQPSTGNCPDSSFCAGKADGNYQNPDGFSQNYYSACVAGKYLYCMPCPAGLVYNPTSDSCETSSTGPGTRAEPRGVQSGGNGGNGVQTGGNGVNSGNGKSGESKPSSSSQCPGSSFCSGKADGNYANPDGYSDNYFISCVGGTELYCMECPAELVYNANSDSCERSTSGPGTVAGSGAKNVVITGQPGPLTCGIGNDFCTGRTNGVYDIHGFPQFVVSCTNGIANCVVARQVDVDDDA